MLLKAIEWQCGKVCKQNQWISMSGFEKSVFLQCLSKPSNGFAAACAKNPVAFYERFWDLCVFTMCFESPRRLAPQLIAQYNSTHTHHTTQHESHITHHTHTYTHAHTHTRTTTRARTHATTHTHAHTHTHLHLHTHTHLHTRTLH